MMTRNTEKRVEVACPIYDDAIKRRLIHDLKVMLADNVKARIMTSDGTYKKKERKGEAVNAQAAFMKAALNARPPKTLPKAKKEKKSIFQKVFSAFGKRNRSC
jgi:polyphosphate kinase